MHPSTITDAYNHLVTIAGETVRTSDELRSAIHAWDLRWNSGLDADTADGWAEFWEACFAASPRSKVGGCWAYNRRVQFPRRPAQVGA